MKKYKLTKTTKEYGSLTLYQIEALKDFGNVEKGEMGGFIEKEENLSQDGYAWVYDNARVYGDAEVCDNAWVYGNARVYGNAWVCDNARVYGNAKVYGNAGVYGDANVCDNAGVFENAKVYGNARVYGRLKLTGGCFYHTKQKSEIMEKIEIDENHEILCSNPKIAEDEPKEIPEEIIEIDGKEVSKTTIKKALKDYFR